MARTPLFPRAGDFASWALNITQRIERDYAQLQASTDSLSVAFTADLRSVSAVIKLDINSVSSVIKTDISSVSAAIKLDISSVSAAITTAYDAADRSVSACVHADIASASSLLQTSINTVSNSLSILSVLVRGGTTRHIHNILDYGAIPDTDCITAILNAESAAAAGDIIFFPPGNWQFSNTITISRSAAAWIGAGPYQTKLTYTGAAANASMLVFGTAAAQLINCHLANFRVASDTTMTAGVAIHLHNFCRSTIDGVIADGQDGNGKLCHGFWFNQVDHIVATNLQAYGGLRTGSTGIIIDGGVGVVPKADLYISGLKIANFDYGIHVGGGFGGLFMDNFDVIGNNVNLLIDEAVAAEINREMMFGLGAFDTPLVGPNVDINASSSALAWIQFCGTWICTCPSSSGVLIRNAGGHDINFLGCRLYNNSLHAVEITEPLANIIFSGNTINHNGGYGINISVSAHHTRVSFNSFTSNSASNVHDLGDPQTLAEALYTKAAVLEATQWITSPYFGIDNTFYHAMTGGYPYTNWDANDYCLYDRVNNKWIFVINSTTVGYVDAAGFNNGP